MKKIVVAEERMKTEERNFVMWREGRESLVAEGKGRERRTEGVVQRRRRRKAETSRKGEERHR